MININDLKNFVYSNARPLDLAYWKFRFENGDGMEVLSELSKYQNSDGGFGNGIEPDYLNPNSSPIGTWYATEYIRKIPNIDKSHDIILGILKYLESEADFDNKMWMNVITTNNLYPHAIWWECKGERGVTSLNPSASLVAFILDYADFESSLYAKACDLSKEYVDKFMEMVDFKIDVHLLSCVRQMCDSLKDKKVIDENSFLSLKEKMVINIVENIKANIDKWGVDYISYPSMFINDKSSFLYVHLNEYIMKEIEYIKNSKINEGAFKVTWQWWTPYEEFNTSKLYWQAIFITNKLEFIEEFDCR